MPKSRVPNDRMSRDQYGELLAAIVRNVPRDLASSLAQHWITTGQKDLPAVLRKALALREEKNQPAAVLAVDDAPAKHVIDTDADPLIPRGFRVEEHRKMGSLTWDPTKVSLFLSPRQESGKLIIGHNLHKELKDKPVLNANVLDYLLAHPELIPEDWKQKVVYFWGTIYRSPDGNLYVRYLHWSGVRWLWRYDWRDAGPAAVLAQ